MDNDTLHLRVPAALIAYRPSVLAGLALGINPHVALLHSKLYIRTDVDETTTSLPFCVAWLLSVRHSHFDNDTDITS